MSAGRGGTRRPSGCCWPVALAPRPERRAARAPRRPLPGARDLRRRRERHPRRGRQGRRREGRLGLRRSSVTPDQKAAVVLNITNPGFQDFRTDASCIVRPQSLIGEMYVDCTPTQPRPVGTPEPPPLPVIPTASPGAGQHYLPVTNTSSPVAIDLIGDVARLPYTQRLTIIINELGAGLAGNGQALEQVVQARRPDAGRARPRAGDPRAQNHTLAQPGHRVRPGDRAAGRPTASRSPTSSRSPTRWRPCSAEHRVGARRDAGQAARLPGRAHRRRSPSCPRSPARPTRCSPTSPRRRRASTRRSTNLTPCLAGRDDLPDEPRADRREGHAADPGGGAGRQAARRSSAPRPSRSPRAHRQLLTAVKKQGGLHGPA